MLRKDLRGAHDLRPFAVELGLVAEADGSAAVSFGNTKVVASVVGPAQPKYARHELYDRASIEFDIQIPSKTVVEGSDVMQQKKRFERFLQDAMEGSIDVGQFPRTLILFNILIINNDGSILEAMVNACVLAVLDAGIPMLFVPSAVAISTVTSLTNHELILLLDPTSTEEAESEANCTIVLQLSLGNSNEISTVNVQATECSGLLTLDAYKAVNALAMPTCETVLRTMRKFMEAKLVGESS